MLILILLAATLACGETTAGQKVGESVSATSAPLKAPVYRAGDVINIDDYTVTLNSARITGSKLVANFTVDNTSGSKEVDISSWWGWTAKDTDGNKLKQTLCDNPGLDGKVLVGDKLRGDICWDGVRQNAAIKLYYEANVFSAGAIVWAVN